MGRDLRLHPEYGVNPTIPTCFYCGKDKNEVALLGANYKGQAPMHMVIDIEPCDECKAKYADYTLLIEVDARYNNVSGQHMKRKPQPTGRWCAIRKECLNIEKPSPIAYVEPETMNQVLSQAKEAEENV